MRGSKHRRMRRISVADSVGLSLLKSFWCDKMHVLSENRGRFTSTKSTTLGKYWLINRVVTFKSVASYMAIIHLRYKRNDIQTDGQLTTQYASLVLLFLSQ